MSSRVTRVIYDLVARDRASKTFARVGGAAGRLSKDGAGIGTALATGFKVGSVAAAGLTVNVLKTSSDFEKSMNQVRAVSGATGKDFQALRNQAKELGATTKYTASQAADGMGFLAMTGYKAHQILAAMPGTLSLAAAGNMDLARAADISSNIMTGYGFKASQTNKMVDVLAKTFVSTNTDLEQLGEAFKYAGPVAHAAGVKFEQASAAIGLMGNAGLQASMAGTSLRGAITRLLSPTKQVSEVLKKLGVRVKDSSGKLLPLDQIIRQLEKSGAKTGDMMTIFGQRAGPAMLALVEQGSGALVKLTKELEKSGGTADRIAKIQMEGLEGQLVSLKSAWEGLMIEIGDLGVLNLATKGVEGLTTGVRDFTGFVDQYGMPAAKRFSSTMGDLIPIGKIKKGFEDAKTLASDFFKGLAGKGKKPAPSPLDKFPATVLGRLTGAPHLGSGGVQPLTKGPGGALTEQPHSGSGQVAPTTGVQGKALPTLPHGGSGMVAPLVAAKPKVPKSAAEQFGETIRKAVTDGIEKIDWAVVGKSVGSGLGKAIQWVAAHGAELSKKLGTALGSVDWVDIGKEFGKIALPTAIGFVDNLFEPLFHKEFWEKHWLDTILAVLAVIPFGKIFGVVGKGLGKIPWGGLFSGIGKLLAKIPWTSILPFGPKLAESVAPLLLAIGRWGIRIASGFGETFARNFPRITRWFQDQLILLPVRLGDLGRLLLRKGGELVDWLGRGLTDTLPGMGNRFIRFLYKVLGRYSLWQIGINLGKSLLVGIWHTMQDIGSWLKSHLVDPVVGWVKKLFGIASPSKVFSAIGGYLVAGLKDGVLSAAKGIGAWVWNRLGKPPIDRFARAGTWLLSHGRSFVGGLKDGITDRAKGIGGWFYDKAAKPPIDRFAKASTWLVPKGSALISGLKEGIVGAVKGIGDWLKKNLIDPIVGAVKRYFGIKSPSRVFMGIGGHLVSGLVKGLASTNGAQIAKTVFGDLPSALGSIVGKGLVSLASLPGKALKALGGLGGKLAGLLGFGGGGGKGVQQWSPLVSQVLAMLGAPASALGPVLKRIQIESGGNPNAINLTDSNAKAGDPSRGLMQTIGGTFAAYAGPFKGRGIYDPLANIYAGVNYAMHRYGKNWISVMTRPGGYAKGTRGARRGLAWVGERGAELVNFSGGEDVLSHEDSVAFARAHGIRLPGYASGTLSNAEKKVRDAQDARDRARDRLERAKARKLGIKAAERELKAAETKLATAKRQLADARRRGKASVADYIANGLKKTLSTGSASKIASAIKSLNTKLQNAGFGSLVAGNLKTSAKLQGLADKKAGVAAKIKQAKEYASDQAGKIQDFLGISGTSAMSVRELISQMTGQQKTAGDFAKLTKTLKSRGASAGLLAQLAEAGPGSQLAAILGDRKVTTGDIKKLNGLVKSGDALATSFGKTMANAMFDSGKMAGKGFLSGLKAQEKDLAKAMEKLADALLKSIKKKLKIKSPSQVFRDQVGRQLALGMARGMDEHRPHVAAAARRLADTATGGARAARADVAFGRLAELLEQGAVNRGGEFTGQLVLDSGDLVGVIKGTVQPMIRDSESRQAYRAKVGRRG
ncbi:phage tail tape measure protein [Streptomyces sp. NPDC094153]|uniref:phage tail tape measure protein n=1 Tax=Streptomyces sp. NPDC094153 TaxID=3366058 RepID=UPI0037F4E07B